MDTSTLTAEYRISLAILEFLESGRNSTVYVDNQEDYGIKSSVIIFVENMKQDKRKKKSKMAVHSNKPEIRDVDLQ